MIRIILLLSPIFVTLFWALTLSGNKKTYSTPRRFLGRFMLFPLMIYISHFFYFAPLPNIYPYFDVLLQYASLLVFPIYYIYFRLLTVDKDFSMRSHFRYLTLPTILFVIYGIAVLFTPSVEHRAWLFDEKAFTSSPYIQFLGILRILIRITYLAQVVLSVIGNHFLIIKYGAKAEEFYSDIQDGKYNNAKMLNYSIIFMSIAAFTFTAFGRTFLMSQNLMIYIGWIIFSAMLYIIGYMGVTQKAINPTFDLVVDPKTLTLEDETLNVSQKKLLKKILELFEVKKIYLNSQLNILEIVNLVGANRTYISAIINLEYNQNFCTFVNSYRIAELKRQIIQNPEYSNEILAEFCGFGSVNSLKRTISSKTGMSINEWRTQLLIEKH
ncbi:MAG: AraC family transcriptional regulator [Paludibacter sp.]